MTLLLLLLLCFLRKYTSYILTSFKLLLYIRILKSVPATQNVRILGTTLKVVSGLHAIAFGLVS